MRSQNTFYFFLVDGQGRSAYWENNIVNWSATAKPLMYSPDGWKETQIGFARSQKYYGINRQFTNSYKFVEDGASILRYLVFNGQSYETKLYLIVSKYNDSNDTYEPYYRGEIDLVKMQDNPQEGVSANMIEGDLLKFINSSDEVEYELPMIGQQLVQMDPVTLANIARYSAIDQAVSGTEHYVPIVFLSVDQALPGFIYQSQMEIGTPSDEYFFYTELVQTIRLSGTLRATRANNGFYSLAYIVSLPSGDTNVSIVTSMPVVANTAFDVVIDETINMPAGSVLRLVGAFAGVNNAGTYIESALQIDFDYAHPSSLIRAFKPFDLYTALLLKMLPTQLHEPVSTLLQTTVANLFITTGDAIRGFASPVMKTSFSKFFDSFNKVVFAGFGVSGLNAIMEARSYFYDNTTDTLETGEVIELGISIAEDLLVNSLKAGYPMQDIETLNGRYSFNNTNTFTLPVNRVKKEYDQVSSYLSDPYVIENVRTNFNGKDTTDNKSDNTCFFLNVVDPIAGFTAIGMAYAGLQGYYFQLTDMAANVGSFNEGDWFTISGGANGVDGNYRVVSTTILGADLRVDVSPGANDTVVFSDTADISFPYTLKKLAYDSITGVPATSNVYNIEQLTPKRMILAHGSYFRSIMHFLTAEKMVFTTADRNKELSTTIGGVTITEKADIRIDTLNPAYFYPFVFSFKTRVPSTFNDVFVNAVNGHIAFQYNGFNLYGYPLQMSVKPALNEVQEWKVLASTRNNLSTLVDLLADPLNNLNMSNYGLSFSKLCPVQMVPQGVDDPPQYHFRHFDQWTFAQQSANYDGYQPYFQKWETGDTIKMQCITRNLSPVRLEIINRHGRIFDTIPMTQVVTTTVTMPYILFQADVPLIALEPGTYWLRAIAGIDAVQITFLSEPLCIEDEQPKTLLIEYTHSRNQAATIFSTGYAPGIRTEGSIIDFNPRSRFTAYEDEPANMYLIEGQPYRQFTLFAGDSFGLPNYMADKLNRIFTLNDVTIDGKGFTREEDAQFEAVGRINGMPGTWWKLAIREARNYDGTSMDNDGTLNEAAVLINVDTALFGDLTSQASENVVQIEVLMP